jgi:hypothetical protein
VGWRSGGRRPRFLAALIGLALVGALLGVVHSAAATGGWGITVSSWQVNEDTGQVSYDVTVSGVGLERDYVHWQLDAYFVGQGVTKNQLELGDGMIAGNKPVLGLSKELTQAATVMREITDLRLTATDTATNGVVYDSGFVNVHPAYAPPAVTISVGQWQVVDPDNGLISYDVTVTGARLADVGGPCESFCLWSVDGLFGTTKQQKNFGQQNMSAGSWGFTQRFTATAVQLPEITDLHAKVTDTAGQGRLTEAWSHVSDGLPPGHVDITAARWDVDPTTGAVTYDVTASGGGLDGVGESCQGISCLWTLEGWYIGNGVRKLQTTFSQQNLSANAWSSRAT